MSLIQIVIGVLIGLVLAEHYGVKNKWVVPLSAVVFGWAVAWLFLHLKIRKGWSTWAAIWPSLLIFLILSAILGGAAGLLKGTGVDL